MTYIIFQRSQSPLKILHLIAATTLLLATGCASIPTATGHVDERQATLNHGYALLYDFVSQNRDVDKVLILKSAGQPTTLLIREIAHASGEATDRLDAFAKSDPTLGYDDTGLPTIETEAREAISSTKTTALLTTGGDAFEVELLLTQTDGTGYGAALARTLAGQERNEERKAWLEQIAERFDSLHERAVERLTIKTPQESRKTP